MSKVKTRNAIVKKICAVEGKKHQAIAADVREILKIVEDIIKSDEKFGPDEINLLGYFLACEADK